MERPEVTRRRPEVMVISAWSSVMRSSSRSGLMSMTASAEWSSIKGLTAEVSLEAFLSEDPLLRIEEELKERKKL